MTSGASVMQQRAASNGQTFARITSLFDTTDPHVYVTVSLICVSFRALKAGMQRPLLVCPQHQDYKTCRLVAALGALQALYMVRKRSSRDGIQAFSHFMSFG